MIKIGTKAPEFSLPDVNGKEVSLKDFAGKKVLLSWHPFAFTSVCTDQMRALEANKEKFSALNTVALGLSVDPVPSKKAWGAMLCIEDTKLLSDFWPHSKLAKELDIFLEDLGASGRANILLDEKGEVVWAKQYAIGQLPDIEEVLRAIAEH